MILLNFGASSHYLYYQLFASFPILKANWVSNKEIHDISRSVAINYVMMCSGYCGYFMAPYIQNGDERTKAKEQLKHNTSTPITTAFGDHVNSRPAVKVDANEAAQWLWLTYFLTKVKVHLDVVPEPDSFRDPGNRIRWLITNRKSNHGSKTNRLRFNDVVSWLLRLEVTRNSNGRSERKDNWSE